MENLPQEKLDKLRFLNTPKYFVMIDTYDDTTYNELKTILKTHKLYNKKYITKSSSGNITKTHFYFKHETTNKINYSLVGSDITNDTSKFVDDINQFQKLKTLPSDVLHQIKLKLCRIEYQHLTTPNIYYSNLKNKTKPECDFIDDDTNDKPPVHTPLIEKPSEFYPFGKQSLTTTRLNHIKTKQMENKLNICSNVEFLDDE